MDKIKRYTVFYSNGRTRSLIGTSRSYILQNYISNKDTVYMVKNNKLKEYQGRLNID